MTIELSASNVVFIVIFLLIAMLVVQIMTLCVLRSFLPPKENTSDKHQVDNLTFKDLR